MSDADERLARAALRRVWPDPESLEGAEIRAIEGGLSPRSFIVVAGARRCVLRLPSRGAVALLDIETEARAMRAAAAAGLAPPVVAVDAEAGILLTEYRVMPWRGDAPRLTANIGRIARVLRALHAIDVDLPQFVAERIAGEYLGALAATARVLPSVERAWADELVRLSRKFDERHSPAVFCHNDLVADNVLDNGHELLLIDFEYAVRSSPLLDLASLAGMNDYTVSQCRELLAAYYDGMPGPSLAELESAVRMVRLMAFFWARVAEQRVAAPDVYSRLATRIGEALQ